MNDFYKLRLTGVKPSAAESYLSLKELEVIVRAFGEGEKAVMLSGYSYILSHAIGLKITRYSSKFLDNSVTDYDAESLLGRLLAYSTRSDAQSELYRHMRSSPEFEQDATSDFILGAYGSRKYGPMIRIEKVEEPKEIVENSPRLNTIKNKPNKLFISHASKDKRLATAFVHTFLKEVVGVPIDQIFYTSHSATGIEAGRNFRSEIKQQLESAGLVILLISENFSKSQYCIAEMGGAWALGLETIPIHIPPLDQNSSGQLLATLHRIKATDRSGLIKLRGQLRKKLNLEGVKLDEVMWIEALDAFIRKVKEVKEQ